MHTATLELRQQKRSAGEISAVLVNEIPASARDQMPGETAQVRHDLHAAGLELHLVVAGHAQLSLGTPSGACNLLVQDLAHAFWVSWRHSVHVLLRPKKERTCGPEYLRLPSRTKTECS